MGFPHPPPLNESENQVAMPQGCQQTIRHKLDVLRHQLLKPRARKTGEFRG